MTHPASLPAASFVGLATRRLARPQVLWRDAGAPPDAEPQDVFCRPQPYEADSLYAAQTRVEWADRYGGTGLGRAGGSGRCATWGGTQVKGVGTTPLVAPDADALHSSGTLMLFEAATEALFAGVYQACLPFGAVPVQAIVLTGGRVVQKLGDDPQARCVRALALRPFVVRPAHFMRNLQHPDGRRPAGPAAAGWSNDAERTRRAMACLAGNLKASLGLALPDHDPAAILDAGLREAARRYAWQCAAGFAKRLPHGTLSSSNIALDGAYLDFGISGFSPSYRRRCQAHGQEPWTESLWPLRTLLALRRQWDSYREDGAGADLIGGEALSDEYGRHLQQRLAIELAKMAGLTEDMAQACPAGLLQDWLQAMRAIWTRGAHERFVNDDGAMADGRSVPAPRHAGRHDLSAILAVAGPCRDADAMDRALQPLLDDATLRAGFVRGAARVRDFLGGLAGDSHASLPAYLGRQAARKNADLPMLRRQPHAGFTLMRRFRELESDGDVGAIGAAIDGALAQARAVLGDLDPALPGATGLAQSRWLQAVG